MVNYENAMYKIDDMKVGDFIGANYDKAFYGIITAKQDEDGIHVRSESSLFLTIKRCNFTIARSSGLTPT